MVCDGYNAVISFACFGVCKFKVASYSHDYILILCLIALYCALILIPVAVGMFQFLVGVMPMLMQRFHVKPGAGMYSKQEFYQALAFGGYNQLSERVYRVFCPAL